MSGFIGVLTMSALMGAASFGIGMLPLSLSFSRPALAKLSALGTGLLLGAALGVIIPEGIETLAHADSSSELPTSKIAISLLTGFMFMLIVEQLLAPHAHAPPRASVSSKPPEAHAGASDVVVEFDVELGELERTEGIAPDPIPVPPLPPSAVPDTSSSARAYPLTLGLVMHALADGLALGSAALSGGGVEPALFSGLSIVVFFALIVHKAPTALALTTALLSTGLPRNECKRHIAVFSASTPVGALVTYLVLAFFGVGSSGHWPGVALLVSGGTFLYVATVLQPVSGHGFEEDLSPKARVFLVILGMFVPFVIGAIIGHGHE